MSVDTRLLGYWKQQPLTNIIPQGLNVSNSDSKAVGGILVLNDVRSDVHAYLTEALVTAALAALGWQRNDLDRSIPPARAYAGVWHLVLAVAEVWAVLLLALLFLVIGQGLASPSASTLVVNAAGTEERGRILGVQQSAGSLARVVGPAAGGVLFQHAGVTVPYLVGAGVMALAVAVLLSRPAVDRVTGIVTHG